MNVVNKHAVNYLLWKRSFYIPAPRGFEIGEARTSPEQLTAWERHVAGLGVDLNDLGFGEDAATAWTLGSPTDVRLTRGARVPILDTSTGAAAAIESEPVLGRLELGVCDYVEIG